MGPFCSPVPKLAAACSSAHTRQVWLYQTRASLHARYHYVSPAYIHTLSRYPAFRYPHFSNQIETQTLVLAPPRPFAPASARVVSAEHRRLTWIAVAIRSWTAVAIRS